ncbi:MAG: threonylcarbamoyl-AMP synthase [Actinobacteria bacterium]|nr:MAG: threonylcarbamoyl-AMP synthase [Actinomycetota bacterium]
MGIVDARGDQPPAEALKEAAEALRVGLAVALPTDTVYGLAADVSVPGATDRIFEVKHRPHDVDLPVLVADADQALGLATAVPDSAIALMTRFWPGAITLVIPRAPDLAADLGDDDATIGVRCPDHAVPRALCAIVGPLATTSANLHGEPTPETAAMVAEVFGDAVAVVLDGGPCAGSPSTVVDCTGVEPKLLREGRIAWGDVWAALP